MKKTHGPNETDLKEKLRKVIRAEGAWCFSPVQTGMGESGIPDVIICRPTLILPEHVGLTLGLFVGMEAKMHPNRPTPLQWDQLRGIKAAHGKALIVTGRKVRGLPFVVEEV
jgi:hypothetical protein